MSFTPKSIGHIIMGRRRKREQVSPELCTESVQNKVLEEPLKEIIQQYELIPPKKLLVHFW